MATEATGIRAGGDGSVDRFSAETHPTGSPPLTARSSGAGDPVPGDLTPKLGTPEGVEEVTLTFATATDDAGQIHQLPEPVVLATILCAVEGERGRKGSLLRRRGEELEAVAPVYWPLLVVPSPFPGRFAIFDGMGVWRRTFHRSPLPPMTELYSELARELAPAQLVSQAHSMASLLGHLPESDSMTVEGFLPVDPPLLFEVLSHSNLRTEPQSDHSGFLPARQTVQWYQATVSAIGNALTDFDSEIADLHRLHGQVHGNLDATLQRMEEDRRKLHAELANRWRVLAHSEMDRGAEGLRRSAWQRIQAELDQIRRANATICHARSLAMTEETLAKRLAERGGDPADHRARARLALDQEREARRQIEEAQLRIEALHEHERRGFMVLGDRVTLVEQRAAEEIAAQTLARDDVASSGAVLLAAIGQQIAHRTLQRDTLSGYFLPLPELAGTRIIWFPLWVAALRGHHGTLRHVVFPPMQVRTGTVLGDALKSVFGGVVLPLEPRTVYFGTALRETMEKALEADPWFCRAMWEIVRAADVVADPDFLHRLSMGLAELRRYGWITERQEQKFLEVYTDRVRHRHFSALMRAGGGAGPEMTTPDDAEPEADLATSLLPGMNSPGPSWPVAHPK
ncbi:MAG TPA: hypothetical protein VGV89_05675 [Thermoplasmata archaeon]|nr:hypothetical protein [Thermoplasmata archaeon]